MVEHKRIVLDVDGVLANFSQSFIEKAKALGLGEHFPNSWKEITQWYFAERAMIDKVWKIIEHDVEFWLSILPLDGAAESIKFSPLAYLTARPVPSNITAQWLMKYCFPKSVVHTVLPTESKSETLLLLGPDIFVDDKPENILEASSLGIEAVLFNQPHNKAFDWPYRIDSLSELENA